MKTQPELRKEIREKASSLMAAMDGELEKEMNRLSQWWIETQSIQFPACCTEAAISQSNQTPRPAENPHLR